MLFGHSFPICNLEQLHWWGQSWHKVIWQSLIFFGLLFELQMTTPFCTCFSLNTWMKRVFRVNIWHLCYQLQSCFCGKLNVLTINVYILYNTHTIWHNFKLFPFSESIVSVYHHAYYYTIKCQCSCCEGVIQHKIYP